MKKEYIAPELEDLGSVAELTLGNKVGVNLDATFPVGTPLKDLTVS